MCMTSLDSDRAIDTLVALLKSLKHVDHQAAANTAVDKLTQLKNNTLAITDEDVAKTFEIFKESLTEEIKRMLLHEKDRLVMTMDEALKNTGKHITAEVIKAGDEQIARIKRTFEDDSGSNSKRSRKDLDTDTHSGTTGDYIAPGAAIGSTFPRGSPLFKIQSWLIEQYRAMCVVPVSMLNSDIDVPLERIYVPPSIEELKRGQETDKTSMGKTDLRCYKELLNRDGNPVNTIYIQGDPGCGKTTFSTRLVLDWCKAHSENIVTKMATANKETSQLTPFSDIDTLQDYVFLFFVSLRDYSGSMCNVSEMVEHAITSNKLAWDDSVWEHKCIVLTDAADEWYHPDPSPSKSARKCCKDRSMPQYLQRPNTTNIITARPWKLADQSMSDTLTRMFQISGVKNYKTLTENVINVLAEKDGISENDKERKCIDFCNKMETQSMQDLITIPAICVQLVHQFYVGRLIEGSLCAIYINMLDMHIAKGLHALQIDEFDTDEICFEEIKNRFGTETTEYLRGNGSLVRSASALAFKTLTDSNKESSLVFSEKTITKPHDENNT